jgi:3-dehydroquinate synthase
LLHAADPRALYDDRRAIYSRLATHEVDTGGRSPEEVVEAVMAATGLRTSEQQPAVRVGLGDRSYPVVVGRDVSSDVAAQVVLDGCERAFIITHPALTDPAKPIADSFASRGIETEILLVDEGETSKSLAVAERLLEEVADRNAHRRDVVVGFGGGVVCDLAGFVASIYHRGMRVVHVPTTLLAQVDAAVGGKTAVNLSHGKNLVGTIHQPLAVVCDVSLLRSLPDEEVRSGLAEVVKYGLIADPDLLATVSARAPELLARDEEKLLAIVRRSVAIKAAVVSTDERDQGRREILNYGHTFGHAIEHVMGLRHGEAISIGMMAAANLAIARGLLDGSGLDVHRETLQAVGLPIAARLDEPAVLEALKHDKKHVGGVRFVLLEAIGSARTGIEATDEEIAAALRKVTK